jgi:cysteine desulfurase
MQLDEAGIMAAAGSACSASSEEPSHVLGAMGLSDEAAQSSIRFTMGSGTDEEAVYRTVAKLAEFIQS